MSSFPPTDWETRYLREMDTFVPPNLATAKLAMAALLAARYTQIKNKNFFLKICLKIQLTSNRLKT